MSTPQDLITSLNFLREARQHVKKNKINKKNKIVNAMSYIDERDIDELMNRVKRKSPASPASPESPLSTKVFSQDKEQSPVSPVSPVSPASTEVQEKSYKKDSVEQKAPSVYSNTPSVYSKVPSVSRASSIYGVSRNIKPESMKKKIITPSFFYTPGRKLSKTTSSVKKQQYTENRKLSMGSDMKYYSPKFKPEVQKKLDSNIIKQFDDGLKNVIEHLEEQQKSPGRMEEIDYYRRPDLTTEERDRLNFILNKLDNDRKKLEMEQQKKQNINERKNNFNLKRQMLATALAASGAYGGINFANNNPFTRTDMAVYDPNVQAVQTYRQQSSQRFRLPSVIPNQQINSTIVPSASFRNRTNPAVKKGQLFSDDIIL